MTSPLRAVIDLVAANGMDRRRASLIAAYIADRCADLSITTVHSSSTSSLHRDEYLVKDLRLTQRQISAWLALIRGTRVVRQPRGRAAGGHPGLIQILAQGSIDATALRRFQRLAQLAAGGRPCDLRHSRRNRRAQRPPAE